MTRWDAGGLHFAVLYYFPRHQAFPGPTLTPDPQPQPVYRPNCWPPSSGAEALTPSMTVSGGGAWWGLVQANVGSEAGPLTSEDTGPPRKRKPRQARVQGTVCVGNRRRPSAWAAERLPQKPSCSLDLGVQTPDDENMKVCVAHAAWSGVICSGSPRRLPETAAFWCLPAGSLLPIPGWSGGKHAPPLKPQTAAWVRVNHITFSALLLARGPCWDQAGLAAARAQGPVHSSPAPHLLYQPCPWDLAPTRNPCGVGWCILCGITWASCLGPWPRVEPHSLLK